MHHSTAILTLLLVLHAVTQSAESAETRPRGHVFFQADFDRSGALEQWLGSAALVAQGPGGKALFVERPSSAPSGSSTVELTLPVEQMRGYVVRFSARVRAEGISHKPNAWNGVKFMAPWKKGEEIKWPSVELGEGSFDWKEVTFRATVPEEAEKISLVLGLELVTGKVWFDDIEVSVFRPMRRNLRPVAAGPMYKGHDLPRLRGAMVGSDIDEESLRVFGEQWNANLIRWQLIRTGRIADPLDLDAYERWLNGKLERLDSVLPACQKYGLMVVLDLHSPPGGQQTQGGYAGSDHGLFTSAACQEKFVQLWQDIARRYKGNRTIWAFDLANEPVESVGADELADWYELAERAAKAVRSVDPDRAIIVESSQWGGPDGLNEFEPIDVPRVIYSVHMYTPHGFTHQNVHGTTTPKTYPGEIDGRHWGKEQLEEALRPAIEFQKKYNVHMYIGEFSAIRWAPDNSAYRYLRDVIDILEANDWDWTYHAFREWDGWSVEHGADRTDRKRTAKPTDRQQLLQLWYAKNVKPK